MKFNSLGQGEFLQISVWRPSPWQSLPPIWGVGELQRRIRVMTPSPQVTEQEDQGDQWLQPPSCLTVSNTYRINSPCSEIENISYYNGCVKNAEWLTAFVTFLGVAVTGLNRGALTVVVDAVAGASALLDATTTSCRTRGPFRPGGPTILFIGRCRGEDIKYGHLNTENQIKIRSKFCKGAVDLKRSLRQRGQHSPSGTVALAQGTRGQEILRHTVAEFWIEEQLN